MASASRLSSQDVHVFCVFPKTRHLFQLGDDSVNFMLVGKLICKTSTQLLIVTGSDDSERYYNINFLVLVSVNRFEMALPHSNYTINPTWVSQSEQILCGRFMFC